MRIDATKCGVWFTSDTHYGHTNICAGESKWPSKKNTRAFDTVLEMNEFIVNSINSKVAPDDILFHLGDWSFGGIENIFEFRKRILCKNIHLVYGNHDHHIQGNKNDCKNIFTSTAPYREVTIHTKSTKISTVLFHYPIMSWNNISRGTLHLHGHIHMPPDRIIGTGRMMDVGMDGNYLSPHSIMDIAKTLNSLPIESQVTDDHHV